MVHINKKKKEVSSETKNETFTSISTTQEQNNNIVSSSYDNNDEVRSTTATEIFDTSCDNQAITTQSFATNNPKSTKKSLNLGMWNWEAHTWNTSPKQFIAKIKSKGINQIYLQLEIENKTIKYIDQLNQLLDIAYKNRIKIIAIEGSPDMVIDSGLKNAIERNKIIKQFCSMRKNKPSLAGIQYDIEPYILDEYNQDANHIWKLWINAIKMLSQSWGDKIEVVIPFWLLYIDNGEQTVKSIKSYTSKYIIMAYRTNYTQIYNISAEWLTWGDKNEQKIIIALENGLIEDEVDKFNISSGDNEVDTYSSHLSTRTANNEISFMGDEKRLFETVRLLQNDLTQWRSFDGIALHGIDL